MAVRPVITIGAEVLRAKAQPVRDFDAALHNLLNDMLDTMVDGQGVGLAAPQVDVRQRVIIVRLPDDEYSAARFGDDAGVLYEAVNPKIIRASREMVDGVEGCLSIPGYVGTVSRHESVIVRAQNRKGDEVRIKPHGWLARVFQHEIDHLHGILFIDKAKAVWQIDERTPEVLIS
jgi:peptide deformylase